MRKIRKPDAPLVAILAGLLLAGLGGCQQSAAPTAAVSSNPAPAGDAALGSPEAQVREAIQSHLAHNSNLNLQAFDTEIKDVTIQGDHAQAEVDFHVKGGPGVMQMTYQLQNSGGAWAVVKSDPAGSDFSHPPVDGSQGQAPGAPAVPGASHSLDDTLRSFRDGASGGAPTLPAGHPPINGGSASASQ